MTHPDDPCQFPEQEIFRYEIRIGDEKETQIVSESELSEIERTQLDMEGESDVRIINTFSKRDWDLLKRESDD